MTYREWNGGKISRQWHALLLCTAELPISQSGGYFNFGKSVTKLIVLEYDNLPSMFPSFWIPWRHMSAAIYYVIDSKI